MSAVTTINNNGKYGLQWKLETTGKQDLKLSIDFNIDDEGDNLAIVRKYV
jgi:hypothetical protein